MLHLFTDGVVMHGDDSKRKAWDMRLHFDLQYMYC